MTWKNDTTFFIKEKIINYGQNTRVKNILIKICESHRVIEKITYQKKKREGKYFIEIHDVKDIILLK